MQSKTHKNQSTNSPGLFRMLWRGFCRRCPQCGMGHLYHGFYGLRPRCENCGTFWQRDPIDLVAFMYISTALITGLMVGVMVLWTPSHQGWMRWVLVGIALVLILISLPQRKGIAIAVELWLEHNIEDHWE